LRGQTQRQEQGGFLGRRVAAKKTAPPPRFGSKRGAGGPSWPYSGEREKMGFAVARGVAQGRSRGFFRNTAPKAFPTVFRPQRRSGRESGRGRSRPGAFLAGCQSPAPGRGPPRLSGRKKGVRNGGWSKKRAIQPLRRGGAPPSREFALGGRGPRFGTAGVWPP